MAFKEYLPRVMGNRHLQLSLHPQLEPCPHLHGNTSVSIWPEVLAALILFQCTHRTNNYTLSLVLLMQGIFRG